MNKEFQKLGINLRILENAIDPIDIIRDITSKNVSCLREKTKIMN
jgi:hypothetical protein